jgi:predicted acylesterase/phospholipase RssA
MDRVSVSFNMTNQEPFQLQVAFQGGGAKICLLLAVVEAIQELQAKHLIKVKRTCGTSAGSIAACLLGAGIDARIVREYLRSIKPADLSRSFPPLRMNLISLIAGGRPLWKTEFLRKELARIFERDAKVFTLGELAKKTETEVFVVAADLSSSSKVVYKEPSKRIVDAILDSCGIPYCFRAWSKSENPVIVDGGICENLPSDELESFESADGPVIAVAFDPAPTRTPSTLKNFSQALLETAMNNSMTRARLRLGTDRIFSIATDINTFDFARALTVGLAEPYELVKVKAKEFFEKFVTAKVKPVQTISGDAWKEQNVSMMTKLGRIYELQHLPHKIKYLHCGIVVQANCLAADSKTPDYVRNLMSFKTLNDPIYCHGVSLIEGDHPTVFDKAEFSIFAQGNGKPIDIMGIPVLYKSEITTRGVLLNFAPVLDANSGPYVLDIKDAPHEVMKPLREARKDELVLQPLRAEGAVDIIDLVLQWPTASGKVTMAPKANGIGRAMTPAELWKYQSPPGFSTVGWTGRDVPPEVEFGVDLFLSH